MSQLLPVKEVIVAFFFDSVQESDVLPITPTSFQIRVARILLKHLNSVFQPSEMYRSSTYIFFFFFFLKFIYFALGSAV